MLNHVFVYGVHQASTASETVNAKESWFALGLVFHISQAEYLLVAKDYGPNAHDLAVTETEDNIFAFDLFYWDRSQFEHV